MKVDQFVALLVRFFVIYLFLTLVFQMGMSLVIFISQYEETVNVPIIGYTTLLLVLLAILALIWKYALILSKGIVSNTGGVVNTVISIEALEALCFTILGFWIVMDSLVVTVQYLLNIKLAQYSGATVQVNIFGHVARLAVGIWLVLGAKGIIKVIRKLRS